MSKPDVPLYLSYNERGQAAILKDISKKSTNTPVVKQRLRNLVNVRLDVFSMNILTSD